MTQDTYRKALEAAHAEMEELQVKQEQTEKRIAQLRHTIGSLLPLVLADEKGQPVRDATPYMEPLEQLGLTDLVREVLKASDIPLRPLQVKEGLERLGFDITPYQNITATVHTILKRLASNGEVERTVEGGRTAYRLMSGNEQKERAK